MRALGAFVIAVAVVGNAALAGAITPPCNLKSENHFGFGLVMNLPKQWLGFSFFGTRPNQVSLYIDMKTTIPMEYGGDYLYHNISVAQAEEWNDPLQEEHSTWISLNVGLTKVLSSRVAGYVAVGYAGFTTYRNYYDEFQILGDRGSYWVEAENSSFINGLAGLLITAGRNWGIQVGGEAVPRGVTLGAFWTPAR